MSILHLSDINLTIKRVNYHDIAKLERKFEEKYQERCKLKTGPESEEYKSLTAELISIDEEIDSLILG